MIDVCPIHKQAWPKNVHFLLDRFFSGAKKAILSGKERTLWDTGYHELSFYSRKIFQEIDDWYQQKEL